MELFYCYGEVRAIGLRTYLEERGYWQERALIATHIGSSYLLTLRGPGGGHTGFWMNTDRYLTGMSDLDGSAYAAAEYPALVADLTALSPVIQGRLHVYHEDGEQEGCVFYDYDPQHGWLRALPVDIMVPASLYPALSPLSTAPSRRVLRYRHKPRVGSMVIELDVQPWKGPAQKEGKAE